MPFVESLCMSAGIVACRTREGPAEAGPLILFVRDLVFSVSLCLGGP
jgi:hypothetical protein